MKQLKTLLTAAIWLLATVAPAQQKFKNTAFKSGEFLSYNLYYNWKFVWVKAGTASLSTVASSYKGHSAYRSSLITRGNGRLDDYFVLRDTLLSYTSLDLEPLYFRKGAREGDRYTVDEVWYSYTGNKTNVQMKRLKNNGTTSTKKITMNETTFDMLNLFIRARSFDPANWKKGFHVKVPVADGNSTSTGILTYEGKSTIKADNGKKYRCLALTYQEYEKGKWRKIATFYVTDDLNHIPVRIDMFLKFGSAKAFLVGMKGQRNEIKSIVK